MIDVGTLIMKVDADTKGFTSGTSVVNRGMSSIGKTVKTVGKTVAVGTVAAAGALTAIGVSSVNASKTFNSAMSEVGAITQATDEDMQKLNSTAIELGATTAFSASESADGMKYLGMAGYETNQIIEAMPGLLDLAAASGSDLGITADIVSDSMSALKMEAEDTGRFADVMAKATTSANVTVEGLGESFKYAAPLAGALSFSVEDLSAVLATMGNKGIKASQAGTTFKTAMTKMVSSAVDGKIAVGNQEVAISNLDGSMRDLDDIVYDLQKGFSTLSESEKAVTAESLFGKTAMTGMLAVVDDADGSFAKLDEAMDNASGTAEKMSDEMLDNLEGDLTLLGSAAESAQIKIGNKLEPAIRDLVQWTTENLPGFTDAFITGFDMATEAMDGLENTGAGLKEFFDDEMTPSFDRIRDWWSGNGPEIQSMGEDALNGIGVVGEDLWTMFDTKLLPKFEEFGDYVIENWPEMKDTVVESYDGMKAVLDPLSELVGVNP